MEWSALVIDLLSLYIIQKEISDYFLYLQAIAIVESLESGLYSSFGK